MKNRKPFLWIIAIACIATMTEGDLIDITYLQSAVDKGAVCLDGSPPAYHISKGFSTGMNNWLVHLEGGGWCRENDMGCFYRKNSSLGSSKLMETQKDFLGILDNKQESNPEFYNWNRVFVRYCDGSSFTGDIEDVDPSTGIHYRGERIWNAIMEELLAMGMKEAENALLSGCSAGGLASILHCDKFSAIFQSDTRAKCIADAGFFINIEDITGNPYIKTFYKDVVITHGSEKNLPKSCTSKMDPGLCFFPQYIIQTIQTPLFIVNPCYDTWQLGNILISPSADPNGAWSSCRQNITQCPSAQLETIQDFRGKFLDALMESGNSSTRGMFINSCFIHCQTEWNAWYGKDSPVLQKTAMATAVGNWFYDRRSFQEIDYPYPCDSSCVNIGF